jgi:hypothetical protein
LAVSLEQYGRGSTLAIAARERKDTDAFVGLFTEDPRHF